MAIRHRIVDADTLESIAFQYYGDDGFLRIDDLIAYNGLISPHLSTEWKDRYIPYAKGLIYVRRITAQTAITIKKNWTFQTVPSIISSATKTYLVTEDITIEAGVYEAYIPVRSLIKGLQGNAIARTVRVLGKEFIQQAIEFVEVDNPYPIAGGLDGTVLTTGDYIFIPTEEDGQVEDDTQGTNYTKVHYYYGEDLKLEDNDLAINTGDLVTVNFLDNVEQAVTQRLQAERGDNPYDQNYGTDIYMLIGNGGIPRSVLPQRVTLEIYRTLSFEDRVYEPNVTRVEINDEEKTAYVDVTMRVVNIERVLEIRNLPIGGRI